MPPKSFNTDNLTREDLILLVNNLFDDIKELNEQLIHKNHLIASIKIEVEKMEEIIKKYE